MVGGAWLVQWVEHGSLDLSSLSGMLGVEITKENKLLK